ncbi:sulfur carrier protein ThiS [Oceanibaculum pacificum]|uniref:Thiamine biosynthesis protein ThiS n=1 Tax=Oceanibaculum pacificum TaxID=580166 RepID=A0A154WF20_9PROT|nr:sulfur carrier protein ThiS [Oceanibaculum pacificum]KZD12086.1 hypothetical protein AUP43_05460 [Oceanibaculum pacificum]
MTENKTLLAIRVNGKAAETQAVTISDLLAERGLDITRPGIAVAVNRKVVPRAAWPNTPLAPQDEIEIVQPFSGG